MTLLRTLLALIAWIGLPGLAAGAFACRRGHEGDTAERFLAVALVAGLSVWLLGSELLVQADALREGPVVLIGAALAVISVIVLVGPGRAGVKVVLAANERVTLLVAPLIALLGGLPLLGQLVANRDSFAQPTPWYYWQQVQDTVAAHGVPAWSYEWARRIPFLDDYGAFTAGTGVLVVAAAGRESGLAAAQSVEALTLIAAGIALFLLARVWGATRPAAAGAVLLFFALDIYVSKFSSFRPEASAYVLAFLAACFARRWLEQRRTGDLVAAGFALLTLGQEHGIVWLLALCLIGATVLAGTSLASGVRDALVRVGLLGVVVVGTWLVGGVIFGGNLGGVSKLGGLPSIVDGTDPTWVFQSRSAGAFLPGGPPSTSTIARVSFERGFLGLSWQWHAVAGALVVIGLVVGALSGTSERRAVATRCLAFVLAGYAGVLAVSVWFTETWSTYVPRRTGFGRLLPLALVLLPIAAAVVVSLPSRAKVRLAASALLVVVSAGALVRGLDQVDTYANQRPPADRLAVLRSLNLPPRSMVLANSYTEGFLRVVLGARGVVEGRAPYTESRLLDRTNGLLEQARRFFAHPDSPGRKIPDHPAYVLAITDDSWNLGTPFVMPTDLDGLQQRKDLRLERASPGFRLYRVVTPSR